MNDRTNTSGHGSENSNNRCRSTDKDELVPFLRLPQVLAIIPVSRSTWWQWVKDGKAPRGIKLGPRVTAWRETDIKKLIEEMQA